MTATETDNICDSITEGLLTEPEMQRIEHAISNFRRAEFGLRAKGTMVAPQAHYFVPGDKARIQQPANYTPKYLNGLSVVIVKRRITNLLVKLDPPRGCRYDVMIIKPEHLVHQP